MLATLEDTAPRYGAVYLVCVGLFCFIPILYVWLMNNQAGESVRYVIRFAPFPPHHLSHFCTLRSQSLFRPPASGLRPLSSQKRGLGLSILGTVGQCGPLLGTRLFPAQEQPYYVRSMAVSAGLKFGAALIAFCTSAYFYWVNRTRDQEQARRGCGPGSWGGNWGRGGRSTWRRMQNGRWLSAQDRKRSE